MKAKRRLIIGYFLYSMHDKMKWDDNEEGISTRWLSIYNIEEFKDIVRWLFMGEPPPEMDLEALSKEELLATIGYDYHILGYLLSQMEEELQTLDEPTDQRVCQILKQLSLTTHYLGDKPVKDWDSYDYSNYRSLCYKAGFEFPLYGIYQKDVTNDSKYIFGYQSKLYHNKAKAQTALSEIQKRRGKENELQIMKL